MMRHRFGLMAFAAVALILGIPSSPCAAGEVVSPAELKKGAYNTREYTTKAGDVMHYYLYLPAVYTPQEVIDHLRAAAGSNEMMTCESGH